MLEQDKRENQRDLEQYKIAIELLQYEQTRCRFATGMFLILNGLITTLCVLGGRFALPIVPFFIFGLLTCVSWLFLLFRLQALVDLRAFQLRNLEGRLKIYPFFSEGNRHLRKGQQLEQPPGDTIKMTWWRKVPEKVSGGYILPVLFMLIYSGLLLLAYLQPSAEPGMFQKILKFLQTTNIWRYLF